MANIEGWMVTAIIVILAFLANMVDTRRKLQAANERQDGAIEKLDKTLGAHEDNPVSHTLHLLSIDRYRDDKVDLKETLIRLENAVKAVHKRLDDKKNE